MKKISYAIAMLLVTAIVTTQLESCTKNETPKTLKVVSVNTDSGVPLNGATMATGIPLTASIVVLFDKDVNVSTANSTSIGLKSNGVDVPASVTLVGATVTVKPTNPMATGVIQIISIGSALQASDGSAATASEIDFKTLGTATVVPPQSTNQLSYFSFSGNMTDAMGTHTPATSDVKDLVYNSDRFGSAGLAGNFNGSTTIVEIPNGDQYMINNSLTMSVWIKANSTKAGHFVLGLGAWKGFYLEISEDWSSINFPTQYGEAGGLSDSEDNLFAGTGATNQNTGWQAWTFQKDVLPHGGGVGTTYFKDKWAHVVCTYDASKKLATMYLNGEKVKQHDFNLWPDGDAKKGVTGVKFAGNSTGGGNKLALGFIQGSQNRIIADSWADPSDIYSNHFKGLMDDLRIFKVALSETEVSTLYTAEKP